MFDPLAEWFGNPLLTVAILCVVSFCAGLLDAMVGGGGTLLLPAMLVAGVPPINAIATNKLSAIMGAATATFAFWRAGRLRWRWLRWLIPLALIGSWLGAQIALRLSDAQLGIVILILLPLALLLMLRRPKRSAATTTGAPASLQRGAYPGVAACGGWDGLFGPGTGTLLIIVLSTLGGLGLAEASAQTKPINFLTNLGALGAYLQGGQVVMALGLPLAAFNIAGAWIGSHNVVRHGDRWLRPAMAVAVVLLMGGVVLRWFS